MVRAGWWVEGPLDIPLEEKVVDLRLIPFVDCFPLLALSPNEVPSVIGSDLFRLASPCGESAQRTDKGLCVQ